MESGGSRGWLASILVAAALMLLPVQVCAMQLTVVDDQLILSGDVVNGDFGAIDAALSRSPGVTTVILRNSRGGHIATGYQVGELFRQKGLRTAVSGYCNSSCSRMFLGGKTRLFTDDLPAWQTDIGFHGHYDGSGRLVPSLVEQFHLKDWIVRYSDGKADPDLVARWIAIPVNNGMIHFFHPGLVKRNGVSTFLCEVPPARGQSVFDCEPVARTALDLGIITTTAVISGNDLVAARASIPNANSPSSR